MSKRASTNISEHEFIPPRKITLTAFLEGDGLKSNAGCMFVAILNGMIVLEQKWEDGITLTNEQININLDDPVTASVLADTPLVLLLRSIEAKPAKYTDPLINVDNRAGANVDLLPILIGEEHIFTRTNLVNILTGENTGCYVDISISTDVGEDPRVPVLFTIMSANCLPPQAKEGTVYLAAASFDTALVNFGMSSSPIANKRIVWSSISAIRFAAAASYPILNEDLYLSPDIEDSNVSSNVEYWTSCTRILISSDILRETLEKPLFLDIAGVSPGGKMEVRGHYMGFIDAAVLLEPNQFGVSVCTKLFYFSENDLPENVRPLLVLPPVSAKAAKETGAVYNEHGQESYVIINIDVIHPLVAKKKLSLFNYIGIDKDEEETVTTEVLHITPPPEDVSVDVRKIRREEGALSVHSELSGLVCNGESIIDKSIKKTAVTKLLNRVKSLLKDFPPEESSADDWQEIVSAQHAAARRAVAASFAPQPPSIKKPANLDAARSLLAGDERIAKIATEASLRLAPYHPKSYLVKALRCLEKFEDLAAREYLYQGLRAQPQNKYLLWAFGAQEFCRSSFGLSKSLAVLEIAAKPNNSDGISIAIAWAALHALYHYAEQPYLAFIAAKNMRKGYQLPKDWLGFLDRWTEISGQEEYLWIPHAVEIDNPIIVTSAFFLCLRAYKFVEILLNCYENGCYTRGTRISNIKRESPDINYLRGASYLMQGAIDRAIAEIKEGIKRFGPSAKFYQIKATCLLRANGWDDICEYAFVKSEKSGGEIAPALLLRAALGGVETDARTALQRAARAHKAAPCAHSALVLARVYNHLKEDEFSERWAVAAVDNEPNLADGWAFLACLAIRKQQLDKARSLIRTAYQVGPINEDIKHELNNLIKLMKVETLSESLMKDVCFCEYLVK